MASRFILPFADVGNGISPSDGALLEFFETGTAVQKDTFSDEALTTPNTNPVVADGDGVFADIWLPDGGRYKVTLDDKNIVQKFEADPVVGAPAAGASARTFDAVAAMVASTELSIGDIVETAGYLSKGDGGDNTYEVVAAATGTDDGGSFIDLDTHQAKGLFPQGIINPVQFGALADGSDDFTPLDNALTFAPTTLDLIDKTYQFDTAIDQTKTTPFNLRNGNLKYGGSQVEIAVKITTSSIFITDELTVDANSLANKGLLVSTTASTADLLIHKSTFKNVSGDGVTLAAGFFAFPVSPNSFNSVVINGGSKAFDITNTSPSNVSRGFYVFDSRSTIISDVDVRRISPFDDGDGIFVQEDQITNSSAVITNSYFEDCHKRSIKSQVRNTMIGNIVCRRTQFFTTSSGQAEVDLQFGGQLNGMVCHYAAGAAPETIAAGGNPAGANVGEGLSLRNIDIKLADSTDILISPIRLFNFSDTAEYGGYLVDGVKVNGIVKNAVHLVGVGQTPSNNESFKDVEIRNFNALGFSSVADEAFFAVTRTGAGDVNAFVRVFDSAVGSDNTVAFSKLVSSNTTISNRGQSHTVGFNPFFDENTDANRRVFTEDLSVLEDAGGAITVTVRNINRVANVSAFYCPSRDGAGVVLFTEGILNFGNTVPFYEETLVGRQTTAVQGNITISISGGDIVLTKTAGSGNSSGRLSILITHFNSLDF